MIKFIKSRVFVAIITAIICITGTAYAAAKYLASDVAYTPIDSTWKVDNVKDAIDDLYTKANQPLIDKIGSSTNKDFSYGTWQTSRTVAMDLSAGSYLIILEDTDSYTTFSQTSTSIDSNITSDNPLIYDNGTCEPIDGDLISTSSATGYGDTNVHVTLYQRTLIFKCSFTDATTISYNHTRPTAYTHVSEMYKLRSIKLN